MFPRVFAVGIGVGGHVNAWPNLLSQVMNRYLNHRQSNHKEHTSSQSNVPVKSTQSGLALQSTPDHVTEDSTSASKASSRTSTRTRASTGTRARFVVANRAKGGTTSVWALTRLNALLGTYVGR